MWIFQVRNSPSVFLRGLANRPFCYRIRISPPKITMIRIASIKDWAATNQYDGRLSFMNPRSRPIQSITQKVIPLNPSSLLPMMTSTQNAKNGSHIIYKFLLIFQGLYNILPRPLLKKTHIRAKKINQINCFLLFKIRIDRRDSRAVLCPAFRFLTDVHTPSPLHPADKGRLEILLNIELGDCGVLKLAGHDIWIWQDFLLRYSLILWQCHLRIWLFRFWTIFLTSGTKKSDCNQAD